MEKATNSENCEKSLEADVQMFASLYAANDIISCKVRMSILQRIFDNPFLKSIFIYGLAGYKSRNTFTEASASTAWYARIVTDPEKKDQSFIAIEQWQCRKIWQLKFFIPLEIISSIKTELMPTDETRFYLFITVSDLEKIQSPSQIPFKVPLQNHKSTSEEENND